MPFNEDAVEQATLIWFRKFGYSHIHGPGIAAADPPPERSRYPGTLLESLLTRLNPAIPADANKARVKVRRVSGRSSARSSARAILRFAPVPGALI